MSNYAKQMALYATSQLNTLMPSITLTSATAEPRIEQGQIQVALRAQAQGPVNDIALSRTYDNLHSFLIDLLGDTEPASDPIEAVAEVAAVIEEPVEPKTVEEPAAEATTEVEDQAPAATEVEDEAVDEVEQAVTEQTESIDTAAAAALARVRQGSPASDDKPAPRRRSRKAEREAKDAATVPATAPAAVAVGDDDF